MLQISDDIINMLCTYGKPNGVRLYFLVFQFFLCQLAVSRSRRMDDQAFYIGHISKQRENPKAVNKFMRFLHTAFDFKREDGCPAIGKVLLIQDMVRMIG